MSEERDFPGKEEFDRWKWALSLGNWGYGLPVFERIKSALWDMKESRHKSNYKPLDHEAATLAVRVVADTLALEVQAAASDEQDPATVAWVVAGLRCPRQPFCTGCVACFTVAAPNRPNGDVRRTGGWR